MRTDSKAILALAQLARVQDLRVAERALALDDAQQAREAAAARANQADEELQQEEAELADFLAAGQFDPVLFAMKGGLVVDRARTLETALAEEGAVLSVERERQQDWHASRHQRDWLTARHREAARKLRHKQEDSAAKEVLALRATRTMGKPG